MCPALLEERDGWLVGVSGVAEVRRSVAGPMEGLLAARPTQVWVPRAGLVVSVLLRRAPSVVVVVFGRERLPTTRAGPVVPAVVVASGVSVSVGVGVPGPGVVAVVPSGVSVVGSPVPISEVASAVLALGVIVARSRSASRVLEWLRTVCVAAVLVVSRVSLVSGRVSVIGSVSGRVLLVAGM